jgi:subtilisin family serine protease
VQHVGAGRSLGDGAEGRQMVRNLQASLLSGGAKLNRVTLDDTAVSAPALAIDTIALRATGVMCASLVPGNADVAAGASSGGAVHTDDPNLPADDLFASQYYLRNTAPGELDLHMFNGDMSVWDEFTGSGIHMGIIDDGVDYTHPDLDNNYDASREAVVGGITIDGFHPTSGDKHGTATSDIICAERNGEGTVGIAYGSTFTMMPGVSGTATISIQNAMENYAQFDVIGNSWGYTRGP